MALSQRDYQDWFTPAAALRAEGGRLGIITCKKCGAAILLDARDDIDAVQTHIDWHNSMGADSAD